MKKNEKIKSEPKKLTKEEKLANAEHIKRHFCKDEVSINNDIINILEFTVNSRENFRLEYNGLPLKTGNRKLILMIPKTINYDKDQYIPFRPIKNHKHLGMILDYIQHNEYENAILVSKKDKIEIKNEENDEIKEINEYTVELRNGKEILSTAKSIYSEIDAKFRCLYYYFFGQSKEIDDKMTNIYNYNTSIERKYRNEMNKILKGKNIRVKKKKKG